MKSEKRAISGLRWKTKIKTGSTVFIYIHVFMQATFLNSHDFFTIYDKRTFGDKSNLGCFILYPYFKKNPQIYLFPDFLSSKIMQKIVWVQNYTCHTYWTPISGDIKSGQMTMLCVQQLCTLEPTKLLNSTMPCGGRYVLWGQVNF